VSLLTGKQVLMAFIAAFLFFTSLLHLSPAPVFYLEYALSGQVVRLMAALNSKLLLNAIRHQQ
jgi:hypothetical protein